jgi:hypothetical protein
MDDDRAARNEAAFRRVNESLRAGTTLADADERLPFTCECGWLGCNEIVELTLPEYEAVRADPTHFLILPGHEIEAIEEVLSATDHFAVVEKTGAQAQIAQDADPREAEEEARSG